MKILSIDIGTKNLAYCIIIYDSLSKTYHIDAWNIIDITKQEIKICNYYLKNKKKCTHKAIYSLDNIFLCKRHAKQSEYLTPQKQFLITHLKNKSIQQLLEICTDYNITITKTKKKKDLLNDIIEFKNKNLLNTININSNIDLITLCINMTAIFDDIFSTHSFDKILIENQIGNKAIKMKSIQGMITQYFVSKHITDIYYISSLNKLKLFTSNKEYLSYKDRKLLAINSTKKILMDNKLLSWYTFFENNSKKDDLADSFLQSYWYIKNL